MQRFCSDGCLSPVYQHVSFLDAKHICMMHAGGLSMGRTLTAFFSMTRNLSYGKVKKLVKGHTEQVADLICDTIGGDLYRINKTEALLPENVEYPKEITDMDTYDTVYLGYPIYYHNMPAPVKEFLKKYSFTGKTIIPFCTHSGSGMGRSADEIKLICPDAKLSRGLAVAGAQLLSDPGRIRRWAEESMQ